MAIFFNRRQPFFELSQDIIGTNVLTKFHEDWTYNVPSLVKYAHPSGGHVYTIRIYFLSKFHEDWTKTVTSLVFIREPYTGKTAPFELSQYIILTNVLTKFHEDRSINVASRLLAWQMLMTDDRQLERQSQKLIMSTWCSVQPQHTHLTTQPALAACTPTADHTTNLLSTTTAHISYRRNLTTAGTFYHHPMGQINQSIFP
ncbi:hypothetical protein DPMN_078504 [Dreissena polymorpha]|uniref:Uncharacterized protein n=1 Tax=Dreissena polymorpha TaxID=45954 RepID=A0A9D3YSL4_DREPO|nr:hypothetical protein DPMN_078504 [Dreissena polymorpha]